MAVPRVLLYLNIYIGRLGQCFGFFFRNKFNKFNNIRALILVSIYHMALKLLKIAFWRKNLKMLPSFKQRYNELIT